MTRPAKQKTMAPLCFERSRLIGPLANWFGDQDEAEALLDKCKIYEDKGKAVGAAELFERGADPLDIARLLTCAKEAWPTRQPRERERALVFNVAVRVLARAGGGVQEAEARRGAARFLQAVRPYIVPGSGRRDVWSNRERFRHGPQAAHAPYEEAVRLYRDLDDLALRPSAPEYERAIRRRAALRSAILNFDIETATKVSALCVRSAFEEAAYAVPGLEPFLKEQLSLWTGGGPIPPLFCYSEKVGDAIMAEAGDNWDAVLDALLRRLEQAEASIERAKEARSEAAAEVALATGWRAEVRAAILTILQEAGVAQCDSALGTVSLVAPAQKLVISPDARIDDLSVEYVRIKKEPDLGAIRAALAAGVEVPGYSLQAGEPTFQFKRKKN